MKTIISMLINHLVAISKAMFAVIVKVLTNKYVVITLAAVLAVIVFELVTSIFVWGGCMLMGQHLTIACFFSFVKSASPILFIAAWFIFRSLYND